MTTESGDSTSNQTIVADSIDQTPDVAPQVRQALENQSPATMMEFFRAQALQIKGGNAGVLPVIVGLIILTIIFQTQDSAFLSAGNLTNLMVQGATFVLLGLAEVFVLVLGEIDLSTGFVAGIGAVVTCELAGSPHDWPWWAAIIVGLAATTAIGLFQGTLITRLQLPSFVVTLAGLLGWEGVLLYLINNAGPTNGGTIPITNNVLNDLVGGDLTTAASWIIAAVIVVMFSYLVVKRDLQRRTANVSSSPQSVTIMKVVLIAVVGMGIAWLCNTNRGFTVPIEGMPWVVLIVLGVVVGWTFLLGRTRYGRHLYAIGGNPEAARRAGIPLARTRTMAFGLSGLTSGAAGIIYASRLGSISTNIDGGTLVLFAVAAAVIGGTSLFGGRGKMVHALLGGIVIAAIYNGMGLIGLGAAEQYMITALVLIAAVTVDALARRGQTAR